jgi:uncharacterized caspase-like protein
MFRRYLYKTLLFAIAAAFVLGGGSPLYAENWALLVGVNDYKVIKPNLRFCESDAMRMKEALIKYAGFKEEHIKMLLGQEATKKNVKKEINDWLVANVKPGDKALFYFSGHGVQIPAREGDEEVDGQDELLCAYDSGRHSYTFIRDNELGRWMDQINTEEKIVILDCCHSGTATRALVDFGAMTEAMSENLPIVKAYYPESGEAIRESTIEDIKGYDPEIPEAEIYGVGTRSIGPETGGETSISGCRDDQVSLESPSVKGGVLTNYLIESMYTPQTDANEDGVVTMHELWMEARKRIEKKGWKQEPQYYGNDQTALIGRIARESTDAPQSAVIVAENPSKVTKVMENSIQLSIGGDDGVTRGSIYAVYDNAGNRKAQLRITAVEPTTSHAETIEGGQPVKVSDLVELERHFVESENLLILVEPLQAQGAGAKQVAADLTQKIKQKVKALSNVALVGDDQAPDRIIAGSVKFNGNRYDVSLRLINVNIGNSTPEYRLNMNTEQTDAAVETFFSDQTINGERSPGFAALLRQSYNLKALAKLENPKPGFAINVTIDKGDLAQVAIGDTVSISVQPERDCYIHVLNIGASGKISLLFPSDFEPNSFVKEGQKYTIPSTDEYEILQVGPPGEERVKVIATTQKIPLDLLNPENMASPIKTYDSGAAELLQRFMKDLSLMPRNKWATETVMFTVGQPVVYGARDPLELGILE